MRSFRFADPRVHSDTCFVSVDLSKKKCKIFEGIFGVDLNKKIPILPYITNNVLFITSDSSELMRADCGDLTFHQRDYWRNIQGIIANLEMNIFTTFSRMFGSLL